MAKYSFRGEGRDYYFMCPTSPSEEIAENPPGDYGQEDSDENGGAYSAGVQPRPCPAAVFDYDIEYGGRYGEKHKRIVAPCGGYIAVKEGVKCALASTAGAVVARKKPEEAAWRSACERVVVVVIPTKYGGYSEQCCRRSRHAEFHIFHSPKRELMNITGKNPRAMAIMISHAAISDAFLAFSTLPP